MRVISKAALEGLRRRYKPGTRVELVQMDDVQAPPIGTKGTVLGVDDIGSIIVAWDNGSGLSVAYGAELEGGIYYDGENQRADSGDPRHGPDEHV